jgi:hypothetical protein
MSISGMCPRVVLVVTEDSEEHIASIFRMERSEAVCSSEMSVPIRTTWRDIPEDDILQRHRRGNLKSYIALTG